MKKLLQLFIVIFAFSRVAAQSVPDGNFNNWNTTPNWIDPVGYVSSNDQDLPRVPGLTANVTQLPPWTSGEGYAVQLQTEALSGDTFPAYIINSVGDPLSGKGGVPYTGQPTGIEAWLNYSPAAGDTAGMIVVFKKAGIVIGSYKIPIAGHITGYPLESYSFSPALATAPDSVIFAATSSIDILEGKNGFAGSTLALSEVEFVGASTPSDLNWDFDPWYGDTVFSPQGWSATFPGTWRTKDAYTGNTYALDLITTANQNNNNTPQWGGATTGVFNSSYYGVGGGQPYTKTHDTLEFYYKYTQATSGVDSGWAQDYFVRNDSIVLSLAVELPPTSTYRLAGIIDSVADGAPDSAIVTFFSSAYNTPPQNSVGSYLEVDDVHFTSQPLSGIKPVLLAGLG